MTSSATAERTALNDQSGELPLDLVPADQRRALLELLGELDALAYDFVAPTPASQARVMTRPDRQHGRNLADLLGWSLPCRPDDIPSEVIACLDSARVLTRHPDGRVSASIRVSRLFGNLFVHSPYPTEAQDAVFLGPDSHRFGDYILRNIAGLRTGAQLLDYGAGAGVGGITAASNLDGATLTLADINPKALFLASVNATFARLAHHAVTATAPTDVEGHFDLVVMHPPFMIDTDRRFYRDGGDLFGGRLSLDWALGALALLAPGGRLVMHTGASIVAGRDVLRDALSSAMPPRGFTYDYCLLDPDIFGDELANPAYAEVDRIAAVGIRIDRSR